ncbi:hypothetical protein HMN09_00094300 [Mycena chlorophos]|uniref:Extracellular membrane protein CFEM domain-containing protein n=1 Tax=Mycena chlorophos TaxID=658473 RepID=A0A8H6TWS3_MYCCL|nr:hypothetical protein HMN09_00094300 [Mycena chlorophos]
MDPDCTDWANLDFNGPCAMAEHICDGESSICPCSNLLYILNASCDFCLNQTIPSWADYSQSQSCSTQAPDPTSLPDSNAKDAVPVWALAMAAATPTPSQFNLTAAMDLAQGHDTTLALPTSSLTSSGSSSTGSTTPSNTSSPSPSSSVAVSSGSKLNAGAIAGAVIGVLVALALVIWYLVRRRRHPRDSTSSFSATRPMEQLASDHRSSVFSGSTRISGFRFHQQEGQGRFLRNSNGTQTEAYLKSPVSSSVHTTLDSDSDMSSIMGLPAVQVARRYIGGEVV